LWVCPLPSLFFLLRAVKRPHRRIEIRKKLEVCQIKN
jgi:hypothetical protein